MTQQFHEGEEVEVQYDDGEGGPRDIIWRKAKIVRLPQVYSERGEYISDWNRGVYEVQFPDSSRTVCYAEYIRAVSP